MLTWFINLFIFTYLCKSTGTLHVRILSNLLLQLCLIRKEQYSNPVILFCGSANIIFHNHKTSFICMNWCLFTGQHLRMLLSLTLKTPWTINIRPAALCSQQLLAAHFLYIARDVHKFMASHASKFKEPQFYGRCHPQILSGEQSPGLSDRNLPGE